LLGENITITNKGCLLDATKEVVPEVDAEKIKYRQAYVHNWTPECRANS
jgi:hypothetical protein